VKYFLFTYNTSVCKNTLIDDRKKDALGEERRKRRLDLLQKQKTLRCLVLAFLFFVVKSIMRSE
jgi:hypothetical protein